MESLYTGKALQLPKLGNNLNHGKREHRAACLCPSRLVLKHIIATTCSGIRAKVKGGEDGKHHVWRAPYATSISEQKAGKRRCVPDYQSKGNGGCRQAGHRKKVSSSADRRTCRGARHFMWCWLETGKKSPQPTQPTGWNLPNRNLKCPKKSTIFRYIFPQTNIQTSQGEAICIESSVQSIECLV